MTGTDLQITVDGRWQSLEYLLGDVTMSTVWPGGSDELSWTPGTQPAHRFHGGELVAAYAGPACVWSGSLTEPDPSQDQMTATGAWREGGNYIALDSGGAVTMIPNTAIDQAISRGLDWTRPASISASAASAVDNGPDFVSALLDMFSANTGVRWGVNTGRQVYAKTDDTSPTYQTLPMSGGLGYALDNYASTLVVRFLGATGTPGTLSRTDAIADGLHGHVEAPLDLTDRGNSTSTIAGNTAVNLLALGKSTPQWTVPIQVSYGEILTMGGVPVALETVAAGPLLRVHGGFELAQRLNGQMYIDVPIGRTELSGGVLTITPAQIAARNLTDLLAEIPKAG